MSGAGSGPKAGRRLHCWPDNDEDFLKKYERLKHCQHLLRPDKLSKARCTLGEHGAVESVQRPSASVFETRSFVDSNEAVPQSALDHWTHETPRSVKPVEVDEKGEGQAQEESEEDLRFATGMSKRSIRTWEEVMHGYLGLAYYLVFFFFFLSFLLQVYRPDEMYLINAHMRGAVLSEDLNLISVKDQASFWTYLLGEAESEEPFEKRYLETGTEGAQTKGGLLGAIFRSQHYNDRVMESAELGYDVGGMNKLVGGVLVVQERVAAAVRNESRFGAWFGAASGVDADPSRAAFGVALSNASAVDLGVISESETAHFLVANARRQVAQLKQAFTYSDEHHGFAHLFLSGDGRDANLEFGWLLRQFRWLDRQTSAVRVKFTVYNGNLGVFVYCTLNLRFLRAGNFDRTEVAPYTIDLKGVRLEPDAVGTGATVTECVFVCLVGFQVAQVLIEMFESLMQGGLRQLRTFLCSFWTLLDLLNLSLILYSLYARYTFQQHILENPLKVPPTELDSIFDESRAMQDVQMLVNGINILLCILRFFSYYRFQEKLNVLTMTFRIGATDLYHFSITMLATFVLVALIGHFLFGSTNLNFSSLGMSLTTILEMTVNNYDLAMMRRGSWWADPFMIFVSLYIAQIWFGCLMAILMSAFSEAAGSSEAEEEVGGGSELNRPGKFTVGEQVYRGLHKLYEKARAKHSSLNSLTLRRAKRPRDGEEGGDEYGEGGKSKDSSGTEGDAYYLKEELIATVCEILQEKEQEDFNLDEAVEELLALCPTVKDRMILRQALLGKIYMLIAVDPPPPNITGFRDDVLHGNEVLWSEVELLQQENLRLRSAIKAYQLQVEDRLAQQQAVHDQTLEDMSAETRTVGKYKRGFLRKKGGYRAGTDWLEEGSRKLPGVAWKWRWVVLTPQYIAYYDSVNAVKASFIVSLVDLANIEIDILGVESSSAAGDSMTRDMVGGGCSGGFSWALLTANCRLELLGCDEQERTDWLVAIKGNIDRLLKDAMDRSITASVALRRRSAKSGAPKTATSMPLENGPSARDRVVDDATGPRTERTKKNLSQETFSKRSSVGSDQL